jgi:hypothetical protein
MRLLILLTAAATGSLLQLAQLTLWVEDSQSRGNLQSDNQQSAGKRAPWPVQLEMRVPFEPTAFPSGPDVYIMYELHLTNFGTVPLSLSRI